MQDSTPFDGRPLYRPLARLAIDVYRQGDGPTLHQLIAIGRIRLRLHARANRHTPNGWTPAGPAADVLTCSRCGAEGRLELETGVEIPGRLLEACK